VAFYRNDKIRYENVLRLVFACWSGHSPRQSWLDTSEFQGLTASLDSGHPIGSSKRCLGSFYARLDRAIAHGESEEKATRHIAASHVSRCSSQGVSQLETNLWTPCYAHDSGNRTAEVPA
jgi:hypothetical protein